MKFIYAFCQKTRLLLSPIFSNDNSGKHEFKSRINSIMLLDNGHIRKTAGPPFQRNGHSFDPKALLRREADFLNSLKDRTGFPKVISQQDDFIDMSYAGEIINEHNFPINAKSQIEILDKILREEGIIHRDIKRDNMLVLDGVIHLIDFGWAIKTDEPAFLCTRDLLPKIDKRLIYDNHFALLSVIDPLFKKKSRRLRFCFEFLIGKC